MLTSGSVAFLQLGNMVLKAAVFFSHQLKNIFLLSPEISPLGPVFLCLGPTKDSALAALASPAQISG